MNVEANKLVGKYLKETRKSAGLTQNDIATRCNVAQSFISKVELGERSLQFFELFRYSEALGVEPDALFVGALRFLLKSQEDRIRVDDES